MKATLVAQVSTLALIASYVAQQSLSHIVNSSVQRSPVTSRMNNAGAAGSYRDLPLSFEVNRGQTDSRVQFLSRSSGCNLYLTARDAVIALHESSGSLPENEKRRPTTSSILSSFFRMNLVRASAEAEIVGLDELPGKSNYFIGRDPKNWRLNVPNYSRVKCKNAYPGVDVVFYGKGHQLEYDVMVAPGASFKPVRISFDGARRVLVNETGDLVIETAAGNIHQHKPTIYQQSGVKMLPVDGGYVIAGEREIAFQVGVYDPALALVIDPVLVYSTSIGGVNNDNANAIAIDAAGNAYVAGMTDSPDFPTVNPVQAKVGGGAAVEFIPSDVFVTKLNATGTAIVYSTYLGGTTVDVANGVAVDAAGSAYLTGYTMSADFPTTPGAFQINGSDGGDAFVAKLNTSGNGLVYSTRLGGPPEIGVYSIAANIGRGIAVDAAGSAYVTGYTFSSSFPVKRAAQDKLDRGARTCCNPECLHVFLPGPVPNEDAYVSKLNPSGTGLVYSTYLGGTGQEEGYAIALDSSGNAYVTGRTCSRDFGGGAYNGGKSDAFFVHVICITISQRGVTPGGFERETAGVVEGKPATLRHRQADESAAEF